MWTAITLQINCSQQLLRVDMKLYMVDIKSASYNHLIIYFF